MTNLQRRDHKRPVIFGEVLFDHFPDGSVVLGGAPFNVAWHLNAFGQNPLFISRVGDDPLGRRIRGSMLQWDMDTAGLQLDSAHPTGTVEVTLEGGEPHYDIVDERAYDFVDAEAFPPLPDDGLIYHGSLALRAEQGRAAFEQLAERARLPRFLDVNLRPPWWRAGAVLELVRQATWLKLNESELALLDPDGEAGTVDGFRRKYELQSLILTRGAEGASLLSDETLLTVVPEPEGRVVDTVGAGDAFTSVVLMGLLNGWSGQTTLDRAQMFAGAIVGQRGATVQDKAFYGHFAALWQLDAGGG
jgi:fructokinase